MSSADRREGYIHNRVLIESSRVLDAQFSDTLVFLTGAQVEMLRNVVQYLNRWDTYVSEYKDGYYITPSAEDYDSILAIVADMEEELMGNPNTIWGYSDRWSAGKGGISTGESYTDALMTAVPSGYVYKLEHWSMIHHGDVAKGTLLVLTGGWGTDTLYYAPALPAEETVYEYASLTLKEGDALRMRVFGLETDNTCTLYSWGYMMKVPEAP